MRKTLIIIGFSTLLITGSVQYGLSWLATTFALSVALILLMYRSFEECHANARIIALIAVLTATAVVGRQAMHGVGASPIFFIIILAGYVFGPVNGFITGASTILVSNFIVGGHGPWTPYQMIGAGLVGLLAGYLPKTRNRRISMILLVLYAIFSAFLFGAIADVFWWLTFTSEHTLATFIGIHLAGIINNTARAAGNVLFLLFLGTPVLAVLERFARRFTVEYV